MSSRNRAASIRRSVRVTRSQTAANASGISDSNLSRIRSSPSSGINRTSRRTRRANIPRVQTPLSAVAIPLVDLATPRQNSQPISLHGSPVEVDLTCDLDDEVYVVLEDIHSIPRTSESPLPVVLGASSTRGTSYLPRGSAVRSLSRQSNDDRENAEQDTGGEDFPFPCLNQPPFMSPNIPSTSTVAAESSPDAQSSIQCPICLECLSHLKSKNIQMYSTVCGHLFCQPCINQVISNTRQCPTCRKYLTIRKIHPIFI